MHILLTGGAGYIGSHAVLAFLEAGHDLTVIDNLSTGSREVLKRLKQIKPLAGFFVFAKVDLRDEKALKKVFAQKPVDMVVHFASAKSVSESLDNPLYYYDNNVQGSLNLFKVMEAVGCRRLLVSSSAAVYGSKCDQAFTEDSPRLASNPYGRSKLIIEDVLSDICHADSRWQVTVLRYFNVLGFDHRLFSLANLPQSSGGLFTAIQAVLLGNADYLPIYGKSYATVDGTAVRDYIHMADLIAGHLAVLEAGRGYQVYNLGSGQAMTVLGLVKELSKALGQLIPYRILKEREGDVALSLADISKARLELGWSPQYDAERVAQDILKYNE